MRDHIDIRRLEHRQLAPQDFLGKLWIGKLVFDHVVESAEECPVEQLGMVGGGNNQALRVVFFQQLQKRIENAPDLAHIV